MALNVLLIFRGGSVLLLAALFFTPACFSEEKSAPLAPRTSKEASPDAKPGSDPKVTRDPTQPSARLKQALLKSHTEKTVVAVKPVEIPKLPELALKGIVENGQGESAAIVQIAGKELHTVRKGTELSVTASDGSKIVIVVLRVSAEGLQIEVPSQKQTFNLR